MREILFRGKRTDNNEWVYGSPIFQDNYVLIRFWNSEEFEYEEYLVAPETLEQYTGMCDENNTKIFEGDIVNFSDMLYYIIFVDGCFRICRNGQYSYTLHNIYLSFEIVGNIHDNPELLSN